MNDKTNLKRTLFVFHTEANRLLQSEYDDSPLPFQRFLEQIESDSTVRAYLDDCVKHHIPDGFSAEEQCSAAVSDCGFVFGPFSTDPEEESAQVYLILKELVAQNVQGHSMLFYSYCTGSRKYQDKYRGFLNSVARRLIDNIERHLSIIGIDSGLDDSGDTITNNFNGPVGSAQINQPTGRAVVNATQNNGIDALELNRLLDSVLNASRNELKDDEVLEDIKDNLESIREQMTSEKPKRGIIKGAVSFLRGIHSGVQFSAALAGLVDFLSEHGVPILPPA